MYPLGPTWHDFSSKYLTWAIMTCLIFRIITLWTNSIYLKISLHLISEKITHVNNGIGKIEIRDLIQEWPPISDRYRDQSCGGGIITVELSSIEWDNFLFWQYMYYVLINSI